jgi:hypothetical protein
MKGSLKISFLLAAFGASVVLGGCSSGGSSSHSTTPATPTTVTGSVVQGPVVGATVIADLNANYAYDAATEVKTITDENGDFNDLVIPVGYGDYVLVSLGGVDKLSGEAAMPMLAPAGAENITPITTLVALTPEGTQRDALIADLDELAGAGNSYDLDPSVGAATDFVALTQVVEETLVFMEDLGVTETVDQFVIVGAIAEQLIVDDAIGSDSVASSVTDGVVASFDDLTETEFDVSAAGLTYFEDAVSDIVVAVETVVEAAADGGVVTETPGLTDDIADAADTVVDAAEDDLIAAVTIVTLGVDTVQLLDDANFVVSNYGPAGVTVTAADATQVKFVLEAYNNSSTVKNYTGVSVSLAIVDQDSQRTATFILTGAAVEVAENVLDSAVTTVDLSSASLSVVATDSAGNSITTSAVTGPFEIFTITNNEVVLDLAEAQALFTDQVAAEFASIGLVGNYTLTLNGEGAPIINDAIALTVQD